MNYEHWHQHDDPKISVVIPSYPASNHRPTCRHIQDTQSFDDYEIIAVNDAQLDVCQARTRGIEESNADIIACTDDDCEPPAEWLASIWDAFKDAPELGLVEGPVEGGINYEGSHLYVGCNLAMRKDAALDIDGFDSRFAAWREDTEFGWRMEEHPDWEVAYDSSIRMVHPPYPRTNLRMREERLLRSEHPDRYEQYLNQSLMQRLWRLGMRVGIVPFINKLRRPSQ